MGVKYGAFEEDVDLDSFEENDEQQVKKAFFDEQPKDSKPCKCRRDCGCDDTQRRKRR